MKQKGMRLAALLLAIAGMTLWLTGCRTSSNTGASSFSDISYADSEKYISGAAELTETVEHIDIHWLVGSVTVKPHGSDTVSFSEESAKELTDDVRLRYWLDGTTLRIQFCRAGKWRLDDMEKDLTVLVPEELALTSLTVRSLSADVNLDTIQAESTDISTNSGNVELTECSMTDIVQVGTTSGALDMSLIQPLETFAWDTTSGTLQITAPAVKNFSASSVSGAVSLSAEEASKALDIQTTSGNIDLTLPEDASFTLDYDATSGELSSDLPHTMESERYIFGGGTGEYLIGTISGDVRITAAK